MLDHILGIWSSRNWQNNNFYVRKRYNICMRIVSFDFDATLCCIDQHNNSLMRANPHTLNLFRRHINSGDQVYIVSYRNPDHETEEYKNSHPERVLIQEFLDYHELKVQGIILTNHNPKLQYLLDLNTQIHYDDCFKVLKELEEKNIECIYINPIIVIT